MRIWRSGNLTAIFIPLITYNKPIMKYLLGIVLMICGAIGMNAQEFMPLPVLEHKAEAVNDESYPAETVSVMSTATQSQTESSLSMNAVFDYKQTKEWKYYKILRAVGWSALGVGVPMFWLCAWGGYAYSYDRPHDPFVTSLLRGLIWTGAGLTVASIPILICAYRYRYLAKHMSVGVSSINMPMLNNTGWLCAPAISFALTF